MRVVKVLCYFISVLLFGFISTAAAFSRHNLYITVGSGWADTSWSMLDAHSNNEAQKIIIDATNPQSADDKGVDFTGGVGYNFNKNFALEANYFHFSSTAVSFSQSELTKLTREALNIYKNLPASGNFSSSTHALQLVTKFGIPFYDDKAKVYVDAGPGYVYRSDVLAKIGRIGGSFGSGFEYKFDNRWSAGAGFTYLTGYGKSVVDPGDKYIPFVYAVNANIYYSF